ncbi:hypothetical protein BH766_gp65 [Gordonia phage Demosthenes]|uniref:Uncharacterized protein n=1 Tax=Gordonia phage Demosthenes TaxID=1838067 RepID=A0A160DE51_9CAUD|nr:hypothetical protein BH766_gp65 [Gordonia phage Demosthenes]ANA86065.1 hypothetical protein PBI_DEMOSTHENES_65 [Gordonia phage Demosthenes]
MTPARTVWYHVRNDRRQRLNTLIAICIAAAWGLVVGGICVGSILWAMHAEDKLKNGR